MIAPTPLRVQAGDENAKRVVIDRAPPYISELQVVVERIQKGMQTFPISRVAEVIETRLADRRFVQVVFKVYQLLHDSLSEFARKLEPGTITFCQGMERVGDTLLRLSTSLLRALHPQGECAECTSILCDRPSECLIWNIDV